METAFGVDELICFSCKNCLLLQEIKTKYAIIYVAGEKEAIFGAFLGSKGL